MKQLSINSIIVGFALFSMFFGAGNIIFPPYVGLAAGPEWFTGFLCYYMADVGLALVAVFAMLRTESIDKVESIMVRLGDIPAKTMMVVILVCIGPLLAMPRTCATTFSMAIVPLTGTDALWASLLFTVVFFGLTLAFSIRESALVDLVGRYLTPLLVSGLLLMIVMGTVTPIGPISEMPKIDNVPLMGINAGYQTLDVLAIIVFGLLIVNAMKARGYSTPRMKFISVGLASLIAGLFLFIVYGGLCYLGATISTMYPENVDKGILVMAISTRIFGSVGAGILSILIGLACLTTAIALAGSMGTFFSTLTNGKLPYKAGVIIACLFSAAVANFGLNNIIALAAPILTIVYPGVLAVILLSLFDTRIKNDNVFRFAAGGAMAVSFCEVMGWYWPETFAFIKALPFQGPGLGWLLPSAVCALAGAFVKPSTPKNAYSSR
ncbi:Branched-chain amino acid transport system II carrier protein [uncultured delta proteobacterium]|uniref:Branched-chain amino acid transport system II carrier protein n=1 Tax=uncultured delta proteobacterium TaxID=34034 RepID=A0A212J6K9_9DELT|nr:Branched-chain amino acid transport system II carrier protein [uncultured delta proteobacterium]